MRRELEKEDGTLNFNEELIVEKENEVWDVYNYFGGECPKCQADFEIQTKLTGQDFETHKINSLISHFYKKSVRLALKESCFSCGAEVVAVIKNGRLDSYDIGKCDIREGLWGELLQSDDSKKKQFEREMKKHL